MHFRAPWFRHFPRSPAATALVAGLLLSAAAASPAAARGEEAPQRAQPRVQHLDAGTVMPADLPFSEGVLVDGMLYLSGQIGVKPGTLELVEGGMEAQARQTLQNIQATLEAHGYAMTDVVKCTVFLADMDEWGAFNAVYQEFFSRPYPARSALGANGLALGGKVEVECMAAVGAPVGAHAPTADAAGANVDPPDPDRGSAAAKSGAAKSAAAKNDERVYERPGSR